MPKSYMLKLFVAGNNSKAQNIYAALCEVLHDRFHDDYELELVDVLAYPAKASEYNVFATPTLIKDVPEPLRRVIGKLDDPDSIATAVGLLY